MKYAKYGFVVLSAALIVGFTAQPAAAQQFTGNFTLATEAYWGSTLLQPGDYKIAVNTDVAHRVRQAVVTGEGLRRAILTGPTYKEPVSNQSQLELEQINGVYVIRQLDAGLVGQSFRFVVSKNARTHGEQTTASSTMHVPVVTNGAY